VRHFATLAAAHIGLTLEWTGTGPDEQGRDLKSGSVIVAIDPRYYRPTEVDILVGDAARAKADMGWEAKTGIDELVRIMMEGDLAQVMKG
jgi:GDPmannose 4,6-dehydratase